MFKRWTKLRFNHLTEDEVSDSNIHSLVRGLSSKFRSRQRHCITSLATVSQDPARCMTISQCGALRPLMRLLEKDQCEHRACVLTVLGSLASSSSAIRKELLAADIVSSLVPLLSTDIPEIKCGAACVMYSLSIEEQGHQQIAESGACQELPRLLFRGATSYEEWVIRLLGNLIKGNPRMLHPVVQSGGVKRLVGAAINGTESVKLHAVRVLAVILEENPKESITVLNAGGVPLLVDSLATLSGNQDMGEWAIRGLAQLTSCPLGRSALVLANGIPAIVQMLWEKNDIIKESSARAVANIAESGDAGLAPLLYGSIETLASMLVAESDTMKQWSARAVGNLSLLDGYFQFAFAEREAIHKTIWGLESRSMTVRLEMIQALENLIKGCTASQEIARTSGGIRALSQLAFDESTPIGMVDQALGILLDMCEQSCESQEILMFSHSGVDGLVSLLCRSKSDVTYSGLFRRGLQLLSILMAAPRGLEKIRPWLRSWEGWALLSHVLGKDDLICKVSALRIISIIVAATMGEVHGKLHENDITNITASLRVSSEKCREEASHAISLLSGSSPVYCAQIVSSGGLPELVHLLVSSDTTLIDHAMKSLVNIANGNQENQSLIGKAGAVSSLSDCLDEAQRGRVHEVARSLFVIVDGHERNCQLLSQKAVVTTLVSKLEGANGPTSRYLSLLLTLVSRTLTPGEAQTFEEKAMDPVLKNLKLVVDGNDPVWQRRALHGMIELINSPLAAQESVCEEVSGMVASLVGSHEKGISSLAAKVLSQLACHLKVLPPSILGGGTRVLIPFLNGSSPSLCEQALDALVDEASGEGARESTFYEAGGNRPLTAILTFGTNSCKKKSADLIVALAKGSGSFCVAAVRDGLIKPLVGLLVIEDVECREAAERALTCLTGKDIMGMAQFERMQVITEALNSKGGNTQEVASLMRNMDAFSAASEDIRQNSISASQDLSAFDLGGTSGFQGDCNGASSRPVPPPEPISECLLCPITHELMGDPVIAADGFTYERVAIESWFKSHSSSPMTNKQLPNLSLISNHIVKQLVDKHQHQS